MTDEHIEILAKCARGMEKGLARAYRKSIIPNTLKPIEPFVVTLGGFDEGVQQAVEESHFKMMKLLHFKLEIDEQEKK